LPAPLFLFLAGISFALVTDKLRQKDLPTAQIAARTIRRGAEVLGLGMLFRLQEFIFGWGWSPWTDLLRVDILNTIGLSMMLMGMLCWMVMRVRNSRPALAWTAAATSSSISLLTPLLWTSWRPRWLPWPLESYIDGVHNLDKPQSWLFPIFPWAAFAFAGLALGFFLLSNRARAWGAYAVTATAAAGAGLIFLSQWLDARPEHFYAEYDYWHTSPNFFLLRVGILLILLGAAYTWCRWGAGPWKFSPLIQLGQTSLLVYWVHIEFVYGRLSILPKHATSIRGATVGLLIIFLAMLLLSLGRTRWKNRGLEVRGMWPRTAKA
jgi:uncharacterized membrane protein